MAAGATVRWAGVAAAGCCGGGGCAGGGPHVGLARCCQRNVRACKHELPPTAALPPPALQGPQQQIIINDICGLTKCRLTFVGSDHILGARGLSGGLRALLFNRLGALPSLGLSGNLEKNACNKMLQPDYLSHAFPPCINRQSHIYQTYRDYEP